MLFRSAVALTALDGGFWPRESSRTETWFGPDGSPMIAAAAGRDDRRDVELETVADYALFDVQRQGDRIAVRNVSDTAMTGCLFGETRPGTGRVLIAGGSIDTAEREVRDAPFFSCHADRPPLALTDPGHRVRLVGDTLVTVWLPVDRQGEVTP